MSALPSTQLSSIDQGVSLSSGFSKVSVNQQEIIKFFNEKSSTVMQGMCKFEGHFEELYPLFKGLSIGKPKSLNLRFSQSDRSVYFNYPAANHSEVSLFFSQLVSLLEKEIKFKKVLKKVIRNRNHFNSEQFLLKNAMMGL